MKTAQSIKGGQGQPTSDRAFHSARQDKKQTGVSNSGGQSADQTSNKNTDKTEKKHAGQNKDNGQA
ncbi:hypothetical protein [Hufsiella ginkgonis]|uniref:Uncharacterized protein n=1 Tax=Hufsiella ginkgonis TaxID=2695274 RepID=A0A7K1Y595_9SPHI|nr:hypothetical protein [Hufsiella ginkgonis]MXV17876.1 hypothetical protein [Hufsiella ginkgonis]